MSTVYHVPIKLNDLQYNILSTLGDEKLQLKYISRKLGVKHQKLYASAIKLRDNGLITVSIEKVRDTDSKYSRVRHLSTAMLTETGREEMHQYSEGESR